MPSLPKEIAMNATVHKTSADGAPSRASLKLDPAGATLRLQPAQFAHLQGAVGWTVKALGGSVWITQDGDIRDVVLQAGDSFILDRKGPALISPLGEAQVCVSLGGCRQGARRPATVKTPAKPAHASPAFA